MAVTRFGSGTRVAGANTLSPAPVGSVTSAHRSLLVTGVRPSTVADPSVPSGWTQLASFVGGIGTQGDDTGPSKMLVYVQDGVVSGAQSVVFSGANASWAQITTYQNATGLWEAPAVATGDDTTGASAIFQATASPAISWAAGDLMTAVVTIPTDAGTAVAGNSGGLRATGISGGTFVSYGLVSSSQGNDIGGVAFERNGVSGTASDAPVVDLTFTSATNVYGPAVFVRLRESTSSTVALTPATANSSATAPTGTPGPVALALAWAGASATTPPVSAASGAVVVDLTTISLATAAQPLMATPGPVAVALAPAGGAVAGQPLGPAAGASSVTLAPAGSAVAGQPLGPAPGSTAVTLTSAAAAFSALVVATGSTSIVSLTAAVATVTGPPLTLTPTLLLAPAGVAAAAKPPAFTPTLLLVPAGVVVTGRQLGPAADPTAVTLAPAAVLTTAVPTGNGLGLLLAPATVAVFGLPLGPAAGPVAVALAPAGVLTVGRPLQLRPVLVLAPAGAVLMPRPLVLAPVLALAPAVVVAGPGAVEVIVPPSFTIGVLTDRRAVADLEIRRPYGRLSTSTRKIGGPAS